MNSRFNTFPYETLTVGFDKFFDEMRKPIENKYPPYNILKTGEDSYLIEMAVAGFSEKDLDITLQNNNLVIKGTKAQEEMDYDYIYKGIATREFERSFRVQENVEVQNAQIFNGILQIRMVKHVPEELKPRKIEILGSGTEPQLLQE